MVIESALDSSWLRPYVQNYDYNKTINWVKNISTNLGSIQSEY